MTLLRDGLETFDQWIERIGGTERWVHFENHLFLAGPGEPLVRRGLLGEGAGWRQFGRKHEVVGGVEVGLLRVMSFNVRGFSRRGDGINSWENRAALNVATIKRYAPDLIGFQELRDATRRPSG